MTYFTSKLTATVGTDILNRFMIQRMVAISFALLVPSAAFSGESSLEFGGGLGTYSQNLRKTSSDMAGSTGMAGRTSLTVNLEAQWEHFHPLFAFTPLSQNTSDKAAGVRSFLLEIPYGLYETDMLSLRLGTGLLISKYSGSGGTVVLNNGTSTSTFAKPSGSVSTTNALLVVGARIPVFHHFSAGLDLITTSFLSERRTFNALLQANYFFN